MRLRTNEFDRAVDRAVRRIPEEIRSHLENVVITVLARPTRDMLEDVGAPPGETLLGLYQGAALTERSFFDPVEYPDTIFVFQEPLEEMCETLEELEKEIEITVVHEVAHFLGIEEERLAELGYE
ncbi:MAG: metallopeptidase family protein [Syntrophales bacterium]|jgi:predicted Zn-dependent protease with MMP-like domain|nr:metallopeptidase family protein [Syntrophales bacterium]